MQFLLTSIDILIVAGLVYTLILLLKRTQSIFIFRGIISLLVIYLLAYYLGLALTVRLFQFFFSFFVIILVVVFQREFRRFFESFSFSFLSSLFFDERTPEHKRVTEAILKSVQYFTAKKIGAIIVLPGEQPITRHIEGGFTLNGKVSVPLLVSIFDPSSPGHDGAAIVENDRLAKFAAHLPLADKVSRESGTRHRAGLGLAEKTDAFVIVVSEERGTISVAQHGRIAEVGIEELEKRMSDFSDAMYHVDKKHPVISAITYNFWDRLTALLIAILLWFIVLK